MAKNANISLPDEVMLRLDEEAKKLGLSRSAYISMVLNMRWQQDDVLKVLPDVLKVAQNAQTTSST